MLTAMKSAAHTMEPPSGPSGILAPVGITTDRVDPYTLQVIADLFPAAESGIDFLTRLLRLAVVKQVAQAGGNWVEVAEISITSIRQLAALIGRSYDTTEKYVRVFCALGLLTKTREDGLARLRFALGNYTLPTSLSQLDELMIEARSKVASFAKQVKRRFVQMYGERTQETPTRELSVPGTPATEIQGVINELQQLKMLPEARALQERLAAIEMQLREIDGRLATEKPTVSSQENGRLTTKTVDSTATTEGENGRLGAKMVGSTAGDDQENGRLGAKMVGSTATTKSENGRLETEKPTKFPVKNGQNGRLGAETVGSDAKMVDSPASESPNVNVIIKTITDQINVNVGQASAYFRERFGEPDGNNGFYHKLQKICARPEIWLAAAIEVFVALQRQDDPLQKPGKYFFSRVCDMHKNGISPAAQDLVQRYGELSYAQLIAALRAPTPSQQKAGERGQGQRPRPGKLKVTLCLPRDRQRPGMSREDLKVLLHRIEAQSVLSTWLRRCYQQEDGSCALLMESPLRQQTWLYALEGWQQVLAPLLSPTITLNPEMKNSTSGNYQK